MIVEEWFRGTVREFVCGLSTSYLALIELERPMDVNVFRLCFLGQSVIIFNFVKGVTHGGAQSFFFQSASHNLSL